MKPQVFLNYWRARAKAAPPKSMPMPLIITSKKSFDATQDE